MVGKSQAVKIWHEENFDDYTGIKQGSLFICVHSWIVNICMNTYPSYKYEVKFI